MLSAMSWVLEGPVLENITLPRHHSLLVVRAPEIAQGVLPGQFVMAAPAESDFLPAPLLKRALAVYSVRSEEGEKSLLTLLLKVVGEGTLRLASLRPGDSLSLIGPLGRGFQRDPRPGVLHVLVAGGIGIASFYLLAEQLQREGEEVRLLFGARTREDLVGLADFQELGIPTEITTEDGSLGREGRVTEVLTPLLQQERRPLHLYTCGPNPMMRAVSRLALSHGIPCQISVEAKMACGFGVCLGCSVKTRHSYRLACRHGPVFSAADFVWEEDQG